MAVRNVQEAPRHDQPGSAAGLGPPSLFARDERFDFDLVLVNQLEKGFSYYGVCCPIRQYSTSFLLKKQSSRFLGWLLGVFHGGLTLIIEGGPAN
jgi:hypothetical protein